MSSEDWQRVEDLFHRAAELPPGERPAFLAQERADDEKPRADVESLLANDTESRDMIGPAVKRAAERLPENTSRSSSREKLKET